MRRGLPNRRPSATAAVLALGVLALFAVPPPHTEASVGHPRASSTALVHSSPSATAAAAAALRRCASLTVASGSFSAAHGGRWHWPPGPCGFSSALSAAPAGLALLGRRSIVLLGDSMMRHLFSAAVRALGGDVAPGFWKREGDEWLSARGGRLAWPFMTQLASHLADDGPTGLRGAPLAAMGPQDVYVVNVGHWDAGQSNESVEAIVQRFAASVPAIVAELRRLRAQLLAPEWAVGREDGEGGGRRNCSHPLVVWATPNHILPEPYRELVRADPGRAGHNLDRPERVEAVDAFLRHRSGLFPDVDKQVSSEDSGSDTAPAVLLDLNRLARLGGREWVSGDLVHGSEEFFALAWLHLANVIRANDEACGIDEAEL